MPVTHVALLRGINVGGKHRLPMKDLVAVFERAGCTDVRTYIQSGNVAFRAPKGAPSKLAADLAARIRHTTGHDVPVILRTATQLAAALRHNPFLRPGADVSRLHVMFLADAPSAAAVRSLDPDRSPPDAFAVRGREIYLHLPNGAARSKLTNAWFDTRLETVSTARNWRTVEALHALATTD